MTHAPTPTAARLLAHSLRAVLVLGLACTAAGLSGCRALGLGSLVDAEPAGSLRASSADASRSISPAWTTLAYRAIDESSAEAYLSDLPRARFLDPKDTFADAVGNIVHVNIFLVPSAGDTPIDNSACNITVRHLVLAGPTPGLGVSDTPVMGLYAGGGFLFPTSDVGDSSYSASLRDAAHRLVRSTRGFKDLLGPGEITGRFTAPADEPLARAISGKLETLIARLPAPEPITAEELTPGSDDEDAPAKSKSNKDAPRDVKPADKKPSAPAKP